MDYWASLPNIDIYMDQLIEVLEEQLKPLAIPAEELSLTPNMVNNYVKLKLISAPERKRYSRTQLSHLLMISLLKQVLCIAETKQLLDALTTEFADNGTELHDFFRQNLHNALDQSAPPISDAQESVNTSSDSRCALIATLTSLAAKTRARQLLKTLSSTTPDT